jgi:SAM-dependent methyltransferase
MNVNVKSKYVGKALKIMTVAKHWPTYTNVGFCPICEKRTLFVQHGEWLRDKYKCLRCDSIPRDRALIRAVKLFAPDFEDLSIHESSPGRPSSFYLKEKCKNYSSSHFFPDIKPGEIHGDARCENLESLTFSDQTFDLVITGDVFEHVMNPDKAFREIARILRPGGMHIFTIPWCPDLKVSRRRAQVVNGEVRYLEEPIFHDNPVDERGSLVTMDWGLDFAGFIHTHSHMTTTVYLEVNRKLGLDGKFLEVFISRKT